MSDDKVLPKLNSYNKSLNSLNKFKIKEKINK